MFLQSWIVPFSTLPSSCSNSDGTHFTKGSKLGTQFSLYLGAARNARFSSSLVLFLANSYRRNSCFVCRSVGINEVADVLHNKVLISAAVSSAIGQLLKPFTSAIFYGNNFNLKNAYQAGGLPSSHSAAVVATATSLGLERGFSDAIFGLAVVYASLVMYDAQGVRKEVGTHAKTLNRVLLSTQLKKADSSSDASSSLPGTSPSNQDSLDRLISGEKNSSLSRTRIASLPLGSDNSGQIIPTVTSSGIASDLKGVEDSTNGSTMLKEAVGHTKIEVFAGALLGFFISFIISVT